MSNIYVSEPPTSGKVTLETTAGEIEVELWSKQSPKACRNFIQLCLEGLYDGTIFHRVVPGWIVQGGDPTGTGEGGESIYGAPFADEFHSRLRFSRRGLLGMASTGPNGNGSQFFITLAPTPELQKKNTIFGTVVGDSLFNALKLAEGEVDQATERPVYPRSIIRASVLDNPFADITPRVATGPTTEPPAQGEPDKKKRPKTVKNRKLLSFGDDDDDDDIAHRGGSAMRSSHDLLKSDPALSSTPAVHRAVEPKVLPPTSNSAKDILEPMTRAEPSVKPISPISISDIKAEKEAKDLNEPVAEGDRDSAASSNSQSALSEMLARYKRPSAGKDVKRSRKDGKEDELLARLGSFQSKIRKTKLQPSSNFASSESGQAAKEDLCEIHSQPGCESCYKPSYAQHPEASDWLAHSLRFKNSKARSSTTEYAPKFDDYVTIDPRKAKDGPRRPH
ncbi:Peptidyl-prolyl isomerase cwc27 [Coemansia sp. IMI 209128]|nr:Peptidyl-prolyl isomerase cwc27 [Coemansia sp. IMI 209128]